MKSYIAAVAFALLLAAFGQGQATSDRRVTLTGSVIGVKPIFDYSAWKTDLTAFDVEFYLQFRNESTTPLIIFRPDRFPGKKKLILRNDFSSESGSDESRPELRWKDKYPRPYIDPIPDLLRDLAATEPRQTEFAIIEPGGYYEYHDTLTVTKGFALKLKPGQELEKGLAVPEFPGLGVGYFLSLNDRSPGSLATARRKWKRLGELLLDSNGDYTVKSEIILNKLPE